jgi:hypothetical protein
MVEYYALVYENGQMRPAETVPGMIEGIKENGGGVNSAMIHCKSFSEYVSVPQYNKNMIKKKKKKALTIAAKPTNNNDIRKDILGKQSLETLKQN